MLTSAPESTKKYTPEITSLTRKSLEILALPATRFTYRRRPRHFPGVDVLGAPVAAAVVAPRKCRVDGTSLLRRQNADDSRSDRWGRLGDATLGGRLEEVRAARAARRR